MGDRWVQRQKHKLLLVNVKIFGRKVVALVDSGATHSFVSADFCQKHGLRFAKRSRVVVLADGTNTDASGVLQSARVSIGQHAEKEDFIVMDMKDEEFQCILGKPWLSQVNPSIDWATNTLQVGESVFKGADHVQTSINIKVCSLKSTLKTAKSKGARCWNIVIRPDRKSVV